MCQQCLTNQVSDSIDLKVLWAVSLLQQSEFWCQLSLIIYYIVISAFYVKPMLIKESAAQTTTFIGSVMGYRHIGVLHSCCCVFVVYQWHHQSFGPPCYHNPHPCEIHLALPWGAVCCIGKQHFLLCLVCRTAVTLVHIFLWATDTEVYEYFLLVNLKPSTLLLN